MTDRHDSWFKSAFGVDLGESLNSIKDEAAAALDQAQNAVTQVVQGVQAAVEGAVEGVAGAAAGVAKKVAGAAAPSGAPAGAGGSSTGGTGSFPLGGSVGRGGRNAPNDVRAVQAALRTSVDGQCGAQTIAAIEAFQRSIGQAKPDGRIDAGGATERALAGGGKAAAAPAPAPAPAPAAPGDGDDSDGLLGRLQKGMTGLLDDAKGLGGKLAEGAENLLDDARQLGGSILGPDGGAGASSGGANPALASASGSGIAGKISDFLSGAGTSFDKDVSIPVRKIPALNGKIKIDIALLLHVSGKAALDSTDETRLDSSALGLKVGKWWVTEHGEPALQKSDGLWTNFKLLKADGPALIAETSADTAIGKISLKLTWVGLEKKLEKDALKFEPKVLEAEGKLEGLVINVGNQEIEGLKLTDVKIGVGGQVTVGPEWKKILADLLKNQLRQQFVRWAEQAAVSIGADIIIAGSFIVGGVATIAGAVYQVAFGLALKDLTESYGPNLRSLEAGFRAGMSGAAAPGDPYGKKGHELGQENLSKLLARTREQNPQATDAEIRAAVLAKADEATREAINSGQLVTSLKNGMWDGLLASGKWLFSAKDAATAFQACGLGNDPRFDAQAAGTPQWQAYLKKYPTQSKL